MNVRHRCHGWPVGLRMRSVRNSRQLRNSPNGGHIRRNGYPLNYPIVSYLYKCGSNLDQILNYLQWSLTFPIRLMIRMELETRNSSMIPILQDCERCVPLRNLRWIVLFRWRVLVHLWVPERLSALPQK